MMRYWKISDICSFKMKEDYYKLIQAEEVTKNKVNYVIF